MRPCFVLPYRVGYTDAARVPLFLLAFGVPSRSLARVLGRGAMYWYRPGGGLGRNSIAGFTVRRADRLEHLLADEHHQGWLNIRSRGKLGESFREPSAKDWEAYRAPSRRGFGQRLRRLRGWARRQRMSAWLLERVVKLCGRSKEHASAYSRPGGHRTSIMWDRAMRSMNRYFDDGQHLHGGAEACDRHCRAGMGAAPQLPAVEPGHGAG